MSEFDPQVVMDFIHKGLGSPGYLGARKAFDRILAKLCALRAELTRLRAENAEMKEKLAKLDPDGEYQRGLSEYRTRLMLGD